MPCLTPGWSPTRRGFLRFLCIAALGAITGGGCGLRPAGPVVIACAASNRGVMEAIIADYRAATGREVVASYGPSQSLLAAIEIAAAADLFLPADESFLVSARDRGLVGDEVFPLAEMEAVVAVRRGNPRGVRTAADLLAPDLRVALADPETAAIGGLARRLFEAAGLWRPLAAKAVVFTASVTEVAGAVKLGAADAGVSALINTTVRARSAPVKGWNGLLTALPGHTAAALSSSP